MRKKSQQRNKIVCVFGKTGQGKTRYLQEKIIRPSVLPCIIIDTMLEYQDYAVLGKITDDIRFDKFKMRFHPKMDLEFDIICRCVLNQRSRYGMNFIIDELGHYTSEHKIPMNFAELLKVSRHYQINIFMSVQNPVEMNRRIRGLATHYIIFKITQYDYLKYFSRYDPSLFDRLPRLKVHEQITLNL